MVTNLVTCSYDYDCVLFITMSHMTNFYHNANFSHFFACSTRSNLQSERFRLTYGSEMGQGIDKFCWLERGRNEREAFSLSNANLECCNLSDLKTS